MHTKIMQTEHKRSSSVKLDPIILVPGKNRRPLTREYYYNILIFRIERHCLGSEVGRCSRTTLDLSLELRLVSCMDQLFGASARSSSKCTHCYRTNRYNYPEEQ
jgi:hypothetical protein